MPDLLVPDFKVTIDGAPLKPDLLTCLHSVEVQQSVRLIDQAVLSFDNPDGVIGDAKEFKKGNEVEVKVGYVGEITWAFKGDIISVEPHFPSGGGMPSVIVRAYARLHRYRRGRKQRTFLKQKVSDVIKSCAAEDGLSVEVEDTKVQHDYLIQNNQTNIEYIQQLARRNGFEVDVLEPGTKLRVKKARYDVGKSHTLKWHDTLKSFYVRKSLANVATEVTAVYWEMKEKRRISEKQDSVHGKLAKLQAPAEAKKAFGDAKVQLSLRPCRAPAEAQALAWAEFNERALDAVKGRGTCVGDAKVVPGAVIELEGLGKKWEGTYYVTQATHLLHRTAGYSTAFEVQRTGT